MLFNQVERIVLSIVLASLMVGCAMAPKKPASLNQGDYHYLEEYLSWFILRNMKKHNVKGLSITVIDDQQIVWTKGFGFADVEKDVPATSQTVYRIGSISKVITATEIMRLHGAGKINIDLPVSSYIKDFSVRSRFKNTNPVTLRSLLSHHSGLPSDILAGMWVQNPISLETLVTKIKDESLASPPMTMYKYSNLGFSVLGRVLEVVGNTTFPDLMRQNLLQPLGMNNSSFVLTPEIDSMFSKGYRAGKEVDRTPLRDLPAGSMLSNVEDMGRYVKLIFSEGILKNQKLMRSEILAEMFRPQFVGLELDFGHRVGLDWVLGGLPFPVDERLVWHNGAGTPHQAHMSLLPDKKLGVVILANTDEASAFITQLGVMSLELALEAKYGKTLPVLKQPGDIVPVSVPGEVLDDYAGQYVIFGKLTKINRNGGKLETKLWGRKLDLIAVSHDTFVPRAKVFGFISIPLLKYSLQFKTLQGKQIALLKGLPAPFAFQKVNRSKIPKAWKNRLGHYQIDTHNELVEIEELVLELKHGILQFNGTVQGKTDDSNTALMITLQPISDTEAVVTGLSNGEGGTVRVVMDGAVETLYYSGFVLKPMLHNAPNE